jgi:signal transduction histidine kinase/DNA-binding response OmpR family regulator
MREYVSRLLGPLYDVEAVPDGEAALAAVRRRPPDLVLADVMMPGLDGFGLIRELGAEERTRSIPVILLSARAGEESRVEGMQARADDYLIKPFSARELLARVESHLELSRVRRKGEQALREREAWLTGQKEALQAAVNGEPLEVSLGALVRTAVEQLGNDTRAAFYLANPDGMELYHVVGMAESYAECVDGFPIGPDSFACGLAVYTGKPVITRDVTTEPRWESWLWLAEKYDFRGCWSFPIQTSAGRVVGTFAIYPREPCDPTPRDQLLATVLTQAAAIIIARQEAALERDRAEEQGRRVRDVFYDLIARCPLGVYIVDADFRLVEVSDGSRKVFAGVDPLLGRDFADVLRTIWSEPFASEAIAIFRAVLDSGEPYHSPDTTEQRADIGEVESYDWQLRRVTLPDGRFGVVCYFYETTLLRRAEQALREADRTKDEFLATLAHELRNPLAPIRTGLQLIKLDHGDAEAVEQARAIMERQLAHMVRLIDDLLDLGRISQGKITLKKGRVRLEAVLRSAVEASRPLIEAFGHQFDVDVPSEPILLDADETRLAQVFSNLLNNAAKYTERGGRIRLMAVRDGNEAVVAVEDTGVGIPESMLPKVFEMFTQVDRSLERSQGGLGIGLSISRRLVELHGGSIETYSDGHGLGSRFVVRLPVALAVISSGGRRKNADEATRPTKGRKILVVDDNIDSAVTLARVLKLMGNETRAAHDGAGAIDVAAAFRPEVVLLDIGMPGMNGYDAAQKIREQPWGREMVLVALTGWGQDDDRRRSREAGFNFHMVKPVDPAGLERLLAEPRTEVG